MADFNGRFWYGLGNGKSAAGNEQSQIAASSPKRKIGEFLRVTETSPLIDPSEVVVTSRDVQFALPVVSTHGILC